MPPDRPKKRWQGDAPPENNSKHHKNFKKTKSQPYNDTVPTGLAAIKKKLRDTERLLKRDNISAIVRLEGERQLKALRIHLSEKQVDETEKKLASKYHMVKFFERQKVTRKIKQIEKRMADTSSDKEREAQQVLLDKLKVDLNYILHFPKTEKYIALFPKSNADDPVSSARREVIREKIRDAMRKGDLEEGAIEREFREKKKQKIASKIKAVENGKTSKKGRPKGGQGDSEEEVEEDDDDDEEEQNREDEKAAPAKAKVTSDDFFMADSEDENEED